MFTKITPRASCTPPPECEVDPSGCALLSDLVCTRAYVRVGGCTYVRVYVYVYACVCVFI